MTTALQVPAVVGNGRCQAVDCDCVTLAGHLMCVDHWHMVPGSLRRRVLRGTPAEQARARAAAIVVVAIKQRQYREGVRR